MNQTELKEIVGDGEGFYLEPFLEENAKNKLEERQLLNMLFQLTENNEETAKWFYGFYRSEDGMSDLYELAEKKPYLKSMIYDLFSHMHNPDNPIVRTSAGTQKGMDYLETDEIRDRITSFEYALDAQYYAATPQEREERTEYLGKLKNDMYRQIPDLTKRRMTSGENYSFVENFSIEFERRSDFSSRIQDEYQEFLNTAAKRGYFFAQKKLFEDSLKEGDLETASHWLDTMKSNDIRVDGVPLFEKHADSIQESGQKMEQAAQPKKSKDIPWEKRLREGSEAGATLTNRQSGKSH